MAVSSHEFNSGSLWIALAGCPGRRAFGRKAATLLWLIATDGAAAASPGDAARAATAPATALASLQSSPSERGSRRQPDRAVTTISPTLDAIIQNTPGHSESYATGVPRSYAWCSGSFKPENNGPPPDFTAVTGWGQVYREHGSSPDAAPHVTIEIANTKTYVRLKSTRTWVLLQDQTRTALAGAYFVADFSPKPTLRMPLTARPDGSVTIGPPPEGHNAHYWIARRGTYPAGSVDAVYVQMDLRTSDPDAKLVANVGADWWRDSTAKFVQEFVNNPGAGMSNWVRLSTEWSTLRFYSSSTPELLAAPPPPLTAGSGGRTIAGFPRQAAPPAPCAFRPYEPLPTVQEP